MSCYCDYEPSTVWDERIVRARKQHRCCECRGAIRVGESHSRIGSLFDGRWQTYRMCGDCKVTICDLGKISGDGCRFCYAVGDLMMEMREWAGNLGPGLEPIFAQFNAASKERGGAILPTDMFSAIKKP